MHKIPISVYYCILGALAVLILRFIDESRLKPEVRPNYLSPLYYIRGVLGLLLAGILGYVYFVNEPIFKSLLIYFHTGASAPLIVRTLQHSIPSNLHVRPKG